MEKRNGRFVVDSRNQHLLQKLVCYYDRDAATRASTGGFTPANIDPNLCTHIIFAFANVNNQNNLVPVSSNDTTLYAQLNNLKNSNPQLKTLLAVADQALTTRSEFNLKMFSSMVAAKNTRTKFINSAILLLKDNGFDGLNLDWQYPGDEKSQPKDKIRFTSLCQELRIAFDAESPALILSASVSAEKTMIDNSYYNPAIIAASMDFMNVLSFHFHDTTEAVTAHHSPLGPSTSNAADTLTTQYAMNYWLNLGVPATKLNVGFAAFGVAYTLADPNVSGVGAATSGPAEEGCYGERLGSGPITRYRKRGISTCLYIQGGDQHWIKEQSVSYAVTEGQWVGFDNNDSIDAKVAHIADNFGGACVWALDLDDYTGQFCKAGINPFISYLKSKLLGV
ncbi:hypothetical protein WMY93_011562 [Mugilogobius chulae]|uniref:GH18 domain-containing protein n=1 Tax=Mugilogobius chulae TaxID=88201 RepID=A0AAW0P8Q6_9GOBI